MGRIELLDKLSLKLSSVPQTEEDIIFVLSRIRKVLEVENRPPKYRILNFYCNLALHTKIDSVPDELGKEIVRVHEGLEMGHPFFGYLGLHNQLTEFFKEYQLPNFYDLPNFNATVFLSLLNAIYSDTPVTVSVIKKYQVVVNKDGSITGTIIQ